MKYRITYTRNGRVYGDVLNLQGLMDCLKYLEDHDEYTLIAVTAA